MYGLSVLYTQPVVNTRLDPFTPGSAKSGDVLGQIIGPIHCNLPHRSICRAFSVAAEFLVKRPQLTVSHPPGGRLPLLSARPAVTSPAAEHNRPLAGTKLYCLVTEAHR